MCFTVVFPVETDNKENFKFRGVNTYRLTTFPAELNYEIRYSIH